MQPIDWATLFAAAPNIVTAVVFGFFILKMLERQDKRDTLRDTSDAERDKLWRDYLTSAAERGDRSIIVLSGKVESMSGLVSATNALIIQHDVWERAYQDRKPGTGPLGEDNRMSLITIIIAIVVVGVLLWLVETYVPMAVNIKRILEAVVIIVLVLWLLQVFGLLPAINAIKVGK